MSSAPTSGASLTKRQRRRLREQHQLVVGQGNFNLPNLARAAKKAVKKAIKDHPDVVRKGLIMGGAAMGARMGNAGAGARAGAALSKVIGSGDYVLHGNSLMSNTGSIVPTFAPDGRRGIRIREREFIGDVFSGALDGSTTGFNNVGYAINPSDPNTFPWLSGIAKQFEQWEPNGIIFEYVSTSSTFNGSSQALGVVIAATEYNSADANYATKQEMENAAYAISAKASENILAGVECDPAERPTRLLFCGTFAGTPTSNNLHDLGRFQLATRGMSVANVNVGELWVTYDITFYKKQIPPEPDLTPGYVAVQKLAATSFSAAEVVAAAGLATRTRLTLSGSTFTYRAPPGTYVLWCIYMQSGSGTNIQHSFPALGSISVASNSQGAISAPSNVLYLYVATRVNDAGNATFNLASGNFTSVGAGDMVIKISAEPYVRGKCPVLDIGQ